MKTIEINPYLSFKLCTEKKCLDKLTTIKNERCSLNILKSIRLSNEEKIKLIVLHNLIDTIWNIIFNSVNDIIYDTITNSIKQFGLYLKTKDEYEHEWKNKVGQLIHLIEGKERTNIIEIK